MKIFVKVAVCGNESRTFRTNNPNETEPKFYLTEVKTHGNRGQALEYAKAKEELYNK